MVRAGEKVVVMGVEQDQLLVRCERLNTSFDVDPQTTDLLISPLSGNTIPQLVVSDRYGKVLIDSNRVTRPVALQQLVALLRTDGANG